MVKNSDLERQYRYQFNDGVGKFQIYEINEDGYLEEIKNNQPKLKILKKEEGFQIEHDFGVLKTYSNIQYLDSTKLIVTRPRGGLEKEYYKIPENTVQKVK